MAYIAKTIEGIPKETTLKNEQAHRLFEIKVMTGVDEKDVEVVIPAGIKTIAELERQKQFFLLQIELIEDQINAIKKIQTK